MDNPGDPPKPPPKRNFAPALVTRRKRPTEQQSLLNQQPAADAAASSPRGRSRGRGAGAPRGARGGRGRGRGRGESSSSAASGPFSLGPSMSGSRAGFGGAGVGIAAPGAGGAGYDPAVKTENGGDDFEDMKVSFGDEDAVPFLLPVVDEDVLDGDVKPEMKMEVDAPTLEQAVLNDFDHIHLIQMPPTLPDFDVNSLPVLGKAGDGQSILLPCDTPAPPLVEGKAPEPQQRVLEGQVGKLIVRQSGKVQMQMGDVVFDVNMAPPFSFLQQLVAIDANARQAFALGNIGSQLICTPNMDSLLSDREREIMEMGQ
ncbi:hypothetical protein AMAG_01716 [Allomyces macrogynus ATCC 38327]|uniref:DNA-directed RNA polymerase III subunit RPC4 n=1 Tax=Allomyces macrogynus (strain ATCC 38327) TaxID=578462 RepID=A0A0L0RZJ5_ALLM3|nr:hypothetical protein AMAG_01716 [Allomyces macrogynus ATCC 38327]|eukprot:KNE55847.1 hypothetical protein AMAG_01716 [Allomyces macrogynus ATCC 38327]